MPRSATRILIASGLCAVGSIIQPPVIVAIVMTCNLLGAATVVAQTTESKLASLEKVPMPERQQRLHEAAKSEGEAVIYANMDVSAMKPLTDGFMKRYPGTKAASVHFSGAAIITRLDSEARAGKSLSDVVLSGQLGVLALIDRKVAARYRSPEREFYRDGFRDKEGLWTAYMTNVMVSAYNTRQVKKDEAPRAVEDLLKPRWKGKLTMDSQSYVWFGTILQYLGEEAGLRFMKRLNEQNISHQRGRRLMTQLVAAGEFEMAVETNLNSVLTLSKQGAPLSFAPIQPYFLSPSLVFMSAIAPRPYTAALFIDYLLSEEGQKIVVGTNRMPAHVKIKSPESQLLEGQDVRMPNIFDIGKRYQAIGNRYREIFGGAR
ncbi:MAG TPA: extracellular solute-binding protein [Candidatus Binatia bacterium]|nr:extracellular solute-binding protein [Candidatus Binatia bacterium]